MKFESEQEKSRRQKLKEIRETMWKKSRVVGENLQTGEKLQARENLQQGEQTYNLELLEEKLETVEKIYKRCDEEYKEKIRKSEEEKKTESEKRKKKEERIKTKTRLEEKRIRCENDRADSRRWRSTYSG